MEYLLTFNLAGTLSANPLHGQIEQADLICGDIVEVDAGSQEFASRAAVPAG
jgi:hypothetical protein